jgi:hypothetical protein
MDATPKVNPANHDKPPERSTTGTGLEDGNGIGGTSARSCRNM